MTNYHLPNDYNFISEEITEHHIFVKARKNSPPCHWCKRPFEDHGKIFILCYGKNDRNPGTITPEPLFQVYHPEVIIQ